MTDSSPAQDIKIEIETRAWDAVSSEESIPLSATLLTASGYVRMVHPADAPPQLSEFLKLVRLSSEALNASSVGVLFQGEVDLKPAAPESELSTHDAVFLHVESDDERFSEIFSIERPDGLMPVLKPIPVRGGDLDNEVKGVHMKTEDRGREENREAVERLRASFRDLEGTTTTASGNLH